MGNEMQDEAGAKDRALREAERSAAVDTGAQGTQVSYSSSEFTGQPGAGTDGSHQTQQDVMNQFFISYDGRRYQYNGYHYDELADAVGYAQLMRSQPLRDNPPGPFLPDAMLPLPSDADSQIMASLGIRFERGRYRFEDFRYDHLADAVRYASSR